MKILVLYMPVIHRGYLELIDRVKPQVVALLAEDVLRGLPDELAYVTKKDIIRALSVTDMRMALSGLLLPKGVAVTEVNNTLLRAIAKESNIVMPDEDISIAVAEKYFGGVDAIQLIAPPSRLRYNRNNVEEKKLLVPDRRIALSELDHEMMALATNAAQRSPDWYRQVGLVLRLPDGRDIVAYNEHCPHEHVAATFGDPRSLFKSGVRTDLSHGDHAEHVGIGEAARRGISTCGAWGYITDFPCLPCSRLLVRAGIKRLFYRNPSYGLLDADVYLRMKKMELIEVSDES